MSFNRMLPHHLIKELLLFFYLRKKQKMNIYLKINVAQFNKWDKNEARKVGTEDFHSIESSCKFNQLTSSIQRQEARR